MTHNLSKLILLFFQSLLPAAITDDTLKMRVDEIETDGGGLGFGFDAIELLGKVVQEAEGLGLREFNLLYFFFSCIFNT